jgi:kynurenine aminotransferase
VPQDFYSDEHAHIGANYLRIAFCKETDFLEEAGERLLKLKPYLRA